MCSRYAGPPIFSSVVSLDSPGLESAALGVGLTAGVGCRPRICGKALGFE